VDPYLGALLYVVTVLVLVPVGFSIFKTQYQFPDVVLASLAAGAASLIPTVGGVASYAATVLVLYWRLRDNLFPDIVISVAVARLAVVPIALLL
jgi:predicted PurR-regulated permease PerM